MEKPSKKHAVSVKVQGLYHSFGIHEVLHDINLDIAPGEIFVIMGPSGSGKSVLLKNIIGLEKPTKGKILIDNLDASLSATHRSIVRSIVFQAGALFNSLSVYDNLAFYPREHNLYTERVLRDKIMRTLVMLNLEKAALKFPSELSGGMRKRVAIARSLMMEPQLILYDEPTSELDPWMAANIIEVIAALKHTLGVTSIVVSHDRDLAYSISDKIAVMFDGKVQMVGAKEAVQRTDDSRIKSFFNPVIDIQNPRFKNNN